MRDRFRKSVHPLLLGMMPSKRDFELEILNNMPPVHGNKIFVINHTNAHDGPVACEAIQEHFYVLVGKQRLEFIDRIFFRLDGVVYVDRKNKKSKAKSLAKMQHLLRTGRNLLMCPEGSWNITPSKPLNPLNWGVIELSKVRECRLFLW